MKKDLPNFTISLGLLNYMIGGTVLILPLLGMKAGYINIIVVCLMLGIISYYTGNLILSHLGKSRNIKTSILAHFSNNTLYLKIYNGMIWVNFISTFNIYFQIIVIQLYGLIGQKEWIPFATILLLILLILIVRYYNYSEESIALGIVSIIAYLTFTVWVFFSAPNGEKKIEPTGDWISLISAMIFSYNIHDCLAQNIVRAENQHENKNTLLLTYIQGILIYTFVTFSCYGKYLIH
jgi:amino acid permease